MKLTDIETNWISFKKPLNETTYKELASMIDPAFMQHAQRAKVLNGLKLESIENDTLHFVIKSSKFNKNFMSYDIMVKFDEWNDVLMDDSLNNNERARLLLWSGNIKVNCACPSFRYHYRYLSTVMDAAIYPETEKPKKVNPNERGIVCKHLNRVLAALPFYNGDIASEMKRQREAIERRLQ